MESFNELEGYKDPENQQKADNVRKLVNKGMKAKDKRTSKESLNNAENLSYELARYLKDKYPDKFNVHYYTLSKNENIDDLIGYFKSGNKEGERLFENIVNSISPKIHDVVFIKTIENLGYTTDIYQIMGVFFDENGPQFGEFTLHTLIGPDEWYNFIERMGLYRSALSWLYMKNNQGPDPIFYYKEGKWPLISEIKERLI